MWASPALEAPDRSRSRTNVLLGGSDIEDDQRFENSVFFGFHHVQRFVDFIERELVCRQRRRIDAATFDKPEQA